MVKKGGFLLWLLKRLNKMAQSSSERGSKQIVAAGLFLIIFGLAYSICNWKNNTWPTNWAVKIWLFDVGLGLFGTVLFSYVLRMGSKGFQEQIRKIEEAELSGTSLLTFLLSDAELQASLGDIYEEYPRRLEWFGASTESWRTRQIMSAHWSAAKRKITRLVSKAQIRF